MKLFIPAVGYRIKLVSDWSFTLHYENRNETLLNTVKPEWHKERQRWDEPMKSVPAMIPAGTLLEVDRVYVRTINKTAATKDDDYDSVTFKVINEEANGKPKRVRFWAKLEDVNTIEYELPPDHTISKDTAAQNAKKPKKLTKDNVIDIVKNATHWINVDAKDSQNHWRGKKPGWLTKKLEAQFTLLGQEYSNRVRPKAEAKAKHEREVALTQLEHAFNHGAINLPLAQANRVGGMTFAEWYDSPDCGYHRQGVERNTVNEHFFKTEWVISQEVLYNSVSATFKRLPDGKGRRLFVPIAPTPNSTYRDTDITDFWIEIITSADDTKIEEVSAGITEKTT